MQLTYRLPNPKTRQGQVLQALMSSVGCPVNLSKMLGIKQKGVYVAVRDLRIQYSFDIEYQVKFGPLIIRIEQQGNMGIRKHSNDVSHKLLRTLEDGFGEYVDTSSIGTKQQIYTAMTFLRRNHGFLFNTKSSANNRTYLYTLKGDWRQDDYCDYIEMGGPNLILREAPPKKIRPRNFWG